MQGSPHRTVSARDTLSKNELIFVAEDLYNHSSAQITELAKKLGIHETEMQSLKQFCTLDDFPLLLLLEWKKRHAVASRPQLANALLKCGMRTMALKLNTPGKMI